jgi:hypothetical protein
MTTTLHTITCINCDAPPRTTEKSATYARGVNTGMVQLGSAPDTYQRTFTAFILDTDFSTKWNDLLAAKSASTVITIAGKGVSTHAVILNFDWQIGPHTTLDGVNFGVIVTIPVLLVYAIP